MPRYDYVCQQCGEFELTHSINETYDQCPYCGSEIKRVYSAVGISFKGSGFYSTDSKDK